MVPQPVQKDHWEQQHQHLLMYADVPAKQVSYHLQHIKRRQNAVVSTATRLRSSSSGIQIQLGISDFSLLQNVQIGSDAHPPSYSVHTSVPSCR
jgi:hypothetical protein